jgi:hypothetical protein
MPVRLINERIKIPLERTRYRRPQRATPGNRVQVGLGALIPLASSGKYSEESGPELTPKRREHKLC